MSDRADAQAAVERASSSSTGWGSATGSGEGALLRLLSDGVPRTRADIVTALGQPRAAVGARLERLLASGLVTAAGDAPSSGGRPPARIAFNPAARCILAVDLGATHGTIAITDLDGVSLATHYEKRAISDGPVVTLDAVARIATELVAAISRTVDDIVGVGIGVPGPVEHATGRPVKPPIMPGWDRFDIPAHLAGYFSAPVLVDNDVNLLALGEHATQWPHVDDLLFVKVSTGIGAGIVSGGSLQRGALGAAGDLGHVQVPRTAHDGEPMDDGDLEAIASGPGIARRLRAQGVEATTSADVVALLEANDPLALAATRAAGRDIGEVVATCVNLLNPSVIVIGGSIARAGQDVLAGVREVVYRRSLPLATQSLDIVQSRVGAEGGVRGAAIMVRRHLLAPENIDAFLAGGAAASPATQSAAQPAAQPESRRTAIG